MASDNRPRRATFIGQLRLAIGRSFYHAPLAALLAVAGLLPLLLIGGLKARMGLANQILDLPAGVWLVLAHAFFVSFLAAHIPHADAPTGVRLGLAVREAARAALPLSPVAALALGLLVVPAAFDQTQPVWAWLALGLWAVSTILALPSHFIRHGWAGWWRAPQGFAMPFWLRAAMMLPSLLCLSAGVWLFTLPGLDLGITDGGAILIPILALMTFWASFSCALFSAQFGSRPPTSALD